jgi:cyclopropane fatty-acyl-phospholipid synthase-like methyltransferase
MHLTEIRKSYEQADWLYRLFWHKQTAASLHFGYWEDSTKNLSEALNLHKQKLFSFANIGQNIKVLDMGCGVGGGAFFLAENYQAQVTGINISSSQLNEASLHAKKRGLQEKVTFIEADYLHSQLPEATFDIVWAVESFFHCADKTAFIKEAYRLLKPNGKLVLADYFLAKPAIDLTEIEILKTWFAGFHIPDLLSFKALEKIAKEAGFKTTNFENVSKQVMPSAKRLYQLGKLGTLVGSLIQWLPDALLAKLPFQIAHTKATVAQYKALQKELWHYGFVCLEKG